MVTLDEIAEVEAELAEMHHDRELRAFPPMRLPGSFEDWLTRAEERKATLARHIDRTEQLLERLRAEVTTDEGGN